MGISRSDNAMMAKVFCLFGKRLHEDDYGLLLKKRSVAEIAGYLKEDTYYAEVLTEVKEDLIHREQLETLINRFVWDTYLRLSKYSYGDKDILKMYAEKSEIRQILLAIRLLNAGEMSRFIVSLPAYLTKHTTVDLFKMAAVKSYDDLLSVVERTPYYRLLGRFRPVSAGQNIDIAACETALLTYHYAKTLDFIEKEYGGGTRNALKAMVYREIDLHNVRLIYRMKRFFNVSANAIAANLIGVRAKLSRQTYEAMMKTEDYNEVLRIFDGQRIAVRHAKAADGTVEQFFFMTQRITRYFSQKALRFSTKPVVVLFSYMALLEIEANNLINIIEGTRYNLAQDKIRTMLVL